MTMTKVGFEMRAWMTEQRELRREEDLDRLKKVLPLSHALGEGFEDDQSAAWREYKSNLNREIGSLEEHLKDMRLSKSLAYAALDTLSFFVHGTNLWFKAYVAHTIYIFHRYVLLKNYGAALDLSTTEKVCFLLSLIYFFGICASAIPVGPLSNGDLTAENLVAHDSAPQRSIARSCAIQTAFGMRKDGSMYNDADDPAASPSSLSSTNSLLREDSVAPEQAVQRAGASADASAEASASAATEATESAAAGGDVTGTAGLEDNNFYELFKYSCQTTDWSGWFSLSMIMSFIFSSIQRSLGFDSNVQLIWGNTLSWLIVALSKPLGHAGQMYFGLVDTPNSLNKRIAEQDRIIKSMVDQEYREHGSERKRQSRHGGKSKVQIEIDQKEKEIDQKSSWQQKPEEYDSSISGVAGPEMLKCCWLFK